MEEKVIRVEHIPMLAKAQAALCKFFARKPYHHLRGQALPFKFQEAMHSRNGVEGTISELKRGYGMRRCRYQSLAKTSLQNYLIGAACNIKRWSRRLSWESLNGIIRDNAEPAWA